MENLPFYENISIEIGILGKVPCIPVLYMEICLEMGVSQVKIILKFSGHNGQGVTAVACYAID
jgi:hypothetical protein